MKTARLYCFFFLIGLFVPLSLGAQEGAGLSEVETLIGQGRILRAREVLEAWWEEQGPRVGREERQRSLWLRARLTVDPSMAEMDLRRLVLEFPGGSFSDDALLRLAQGAELRGDRIQAHDHYSALVRGYPSSPHTPQAQAWLAEAGPMMEPREPASAPGTGRPSDPRTNENEGPISIQLGAFRSLDGAVSLNGDLEAAGFEARVVQVRGNELFRVRIGRFEARGQADQLRRRLERAGFESTIVTNAEAEERIR